MFRIRVRYCSYFIQNKNRWILRSIRAALDNLMRDRTTIIIARRKEILEKVDRIIVIEQNCIVETGGPQELL